MTAINLIAVDMLGHSLYYLDIVTVVKMEIPSDDLDFARQCIDNVAKSKSTSMYEVFTPKERCYASSHCIIIFNPLNKTKDKLLCPNDHETLQLKKWTLRSKGTYSPRLIYGYHRNALLVSAVYICTSCKNLLLAHDERLMDQLGTDVFLPFQLFHKSGMMHDSVSLIMDLIACGMSFSKIEDMFLRSYIRSWNQWFPHEEFPRCLMPFKTPSRRIISNIFVNDYKMHKQENYQLLHDISAQRLSVDHTFRISRYVKVNTADKQACQFNAVIFFLNEHGQVMDFSFTRTKSLQEDRVLNGLRAIHKRCPNINMVLTGKKLCRTQI